MAAGKLVIATAWLGNIDFMDTRCAALTQSAAISGDDPSVIFKMGNWAEPALDDVTLLLEKLVLDTEERLRLGQAGAHIINFHANGLVAVSFRCGEL